MQWIRECVISSSAAAAAGTNNLANNGAGGIGGSNEFGTTASATNDATASCVQQLQGYINAIQQCITANQVRGSTFDASSISQCLQLFQTFTLSQNQLTQNNNDNNNNNFQGQNPLISNNGIITSQLQPQQSNRILPFQFPPSQSGGIATLPQSP